MFYVLNVYIYIVYMYKVQYNTNTIDANVPLYNINRGLRLYKVESST